MAKRKKTSPFEDLIDLVALLPWWACIALAVVSYLALSALARPVAITNVQPGAIAQVATQAIWKAFACEPHWAPGNAACSCRKSNAVRADTVILCSCNADNRGTLLADILRGMRYERDRDIAGGLEAYGALA